MRAAKWLAGGRSVAAATNLGGPAINKRVDVDVCRKAGGGEQQQRIDNITCATIVPTMTSFTQASGYIYPHYIQLSLHF